MVSIPLCAQKTLEMEGFLGLQRPFLDLVSQAPRPRGRGRPFFAQFRGVKKVARGFSPNRSTSPNAGHIKTGRSDVNFGGI